MKYNKKHKNIFKAFFLVFCITLYYKCQAEGTCNLVQGTDGSYTISCTGDGIVYRYENVTNEFYIIENCEEMKEELKSAIETVHGSAIETERSLFNTLRNLDNRKSVLDWNMGNIWSVYDQMSVFEVYEPGSDTTQVGGTLKEYYDDTFSSLSLGLVDSIDILIDDVIGSVDGTKFGKGLNGLREYVSNEIQCGSCSEGGGGSDNCCNVDLSEVVDRLNIQISQLNVISNRASNVSARMDYLIRSLDVKSVLGYYNETYGQSYFDFLTNHYLRVARGETVSDSEGGKNTNWFARVETLLAALVFGDGDSTNTVDASESEALQEQISTSFHELIEGPQNEMAQTLYEITPNVIEQVRRFSNTFNSASMPSEVVLFQGSGEDGMKISFHVSGDSVYYDLFRSITTLCWSLVGLFVVYRFLVWSITKIVVLVQFCFNVFTDIFKSR